MKKTISGRKYEKVGRESFHFIPVREVCPKFLLFKLAPEQACVIRVELVGSPNTGNADCARCGTMVPEAKSSDTGPRKTALHFNRK